MSIRPDQKILVVIHGPGRGRQVPTGQVFMKRLALRDPALARQIRMHRTGTDTLNFHDVTLVVFWLADPLRQSYPECYAEAEHIAMTANLRGIRVLNSPQALSNTSKSTQALTWMRDNIPSAKARMAGCREELEHAAEIIGFPCIIRSDELHCQRGVFIARTRDDLARADAVTPYPAVIIEMIDVRDAYRTDDPDGTSLFHRYYHKARAFVFNGEVKASHLFFSPEPIVGLSNSTFAREDTPYRRLAREFGYHRRYINEMIQADIKNFIAPVDHAESLSHAVAAIGLDFAAVDYCILPGGRPVIWEANPYFHLPPGEQSVLFRERLAIERVNQSLDWMAASLKEAFGPPATGSQETVSPANRC
jgi:hypothetical protein